MPNEKSIATGYYKVNKYLLENDLIEIDISLIDANMAVGSLKSNLKFISSFLLFINQLINLFFFYSAEILLVTNIDEPENSVIKSNYNYHFKQSCIPIGHRGMGKTFGINDQLPTTYFVENTIDSFREAFNRGAQMVSFFFLHFK